MKYKHPPKTFQDMVRHGVYLGLTINRPLHPFPGTIMDNGASYVFVTEVWMALTRSESLLEAYDECGQFRHLSFINQPFINLVQRIAVTVEKNLCRYLRLSGGRWPSREVLDEIINISISFKIYPLPEE